MLNPIDVAAVIRDGGAIGRFPDEIHVGVAWWMGASLVVLTRADRIVVAHDGHPTSSRFHERFCRGAVNARHFACVVVDLRVSDESGLMRVTQEFGAVPGALITTTGDGVDTVRISLYDGGGHPLGEESGLAAIRDMIAEDRVPIPVNEQARGRVERYRSPATGGGAAE
ncbi:hypothetical protein SSPO_067800 [Streptomyces antimycoticus]|uniref:Uncharacterized protein n=1 Tax=Streptomyces antimycoticus TaxID=68175 RepID=A0A499USI2_9ACTN|nr:hypothetical protein [Streptomyces antimycoticus]BBJ44062.1 hypothetical protein SSPO_067800 [Streptomyces antimycoticus]